MTLQQQNCQSGYRYQNLYFFYSRPVIRTIRRCPNSKKQPLYTAFKRQGKKD